MLESKMKAQFVQLFKEWKQVSNTTDFFSQKLNERWGVDFWNFKICLNILDGSWMINYFFR